MDETRHFRDMLHERGIRREWVDWTIREPERIEERADGTRHFIRRIPEFGDRHLRVVAGARPGGFRLVTAFFDRRLED